MKTTAKLTALAAIAAVALGSCADNNDLVVAGGEGRVFVSATLNSDVKVRSRAELDDLRDNALIWITNSKGVVYEFHSSDEIPADGLRLLADNYGAEVWAGDSVPASFTSKYFHGMTSFTVAAGDSKAVEVTAKIANTVVAVNFDKTATDVMSDLSMTVGHSQGSLTFAGETLDQRGYFMMNSRDHDLQWTITGTMVDGQKYTRTGTIEGCQPATLYNINVRCSETNDELGGAYFEIIIDDSAIEVVEQIEILSAPTFMGMGFDLATVQRAAAGEMGRKSIWITATGDIVGLELSSPLFEEKFGVSGGRFDLMRMEDEALKQSIINGGVTYYYYPNEETGEATVKLNFEEVFTNALPDGQTDIDITVTDSNGKANTTTFSMLVSADPVTLQPIAAADVWATKATVTGVINKAGLSDIRVLYRSASATDWTEATANINGNNIAAEITGLTPGQAYECCIEVGEYQTVARKFTTEAALQLPNPSFETWSNGGKDNKVRIPGSDLSFWDTGNHGSATMNKNITDASTEYKHSGDYSAKLVSQFVGVGAIGKFAAGNIFAGNYLYTDGTDGELGWGRPFASRPKALKAWVRYEPGKVQSKGAGDHIKTGDTDKGTLYAAIVDGTTTKYDQSKSDYNGTYWPCIVKTKAANRKLFDKNGANVVGYGQVIFNEATAGDGMVEVTIPIEYLRTDTKGVYLILVASASLYGDYFEGGEGSTLYLDDIEFVYE